MSAKSVKADLWLGWGCVIEHLWHSQRPLCDAGERSGVLAFTVATTLAVKRRRAR
jgi:hypothetical protein